MHETGGLDFKGVNVTNNIFLQCSGISFYNTQIQLATSLFNNCSQENMILYLKITEYVMTNLIFTNNKFSSFNPIFYLGSNLGVLVILFFILFLLPLHVYTNIPKLCLQCTDKINSSVMKTFMMIHNKHFINYVNWYSYYNAVISNAYIIEDRKIKNENPHLMWKKMLQKVLPSITNTTIALALDNNFPGVDENAAFILTLLCFGWEICHFTLPVERTISCKLLKSKIFVYKIFVYFTFIMRRRVRRPHILDDDFPLFKEEVESKIKNFYALSREEQEKIKSEIERAIVECQHRMGGCLAYNTDRAINMHFVHYYSPRIRFLKKTYSTLIL